MGKKILLADDSVTIHKVVELTFLDEDYLVQAVSNGNEAIEKLAEEAPDLVIADVHMPPGPSGYEVCEKVRQVHPGVPVLLLAGAFEAFDEERATAAADAYLKKPFDSQRLLETAQRLMADREEGAADEPAPMQPEPTAAEPSPEPEEAMPLPATAGGGEPFPTAAEAEVAAPDEAAETAEPAPDGDAGPLVDEAGDAAAVSEADAGLSPADVDAIARRVVELMGDDVVREVAWEVVPDLAEVVVKDRLRELEEPAE